MDTAKSTFQLHGLGPDGREVMSRRLRRRQVLAFFARLAPAVVAIEACAQAHSWGREIEKLGHSVRLVPSAFVKRFTRGRRKSDARDAKALALCASSPDLEPVPVKSEAQQAGLMLVKARALLVRQHTQTGNALRSQLGELGHVTRIGDKALEALALALEKREIELPEAAYVALMTLVRQWRGLAAEIAELTARVEANAEADPTMTRLMSVPGVGPIIASTFALKVPDATRFTTGRHCAACLGLTPNERSSGKRRRLGAISKEGDRDLRWLLVEGAGTRIIAAKRWPELRSRRQARAHQSQTLQSRRNGARGAHGPDPVGDVVPRHVLRAAR
jgi:transposase